MKRRDLREGGVFAAIGVVLYVAVGLALRAMGGECGKTNRKERSKMSKPYDYPGGFLLTKKKAETLAIQEFGTARGLEQEVGMGKGFFLMRIGKLVVRFKPDVVFNSGRILMDVELRNASGSLRKFYDRETLEEDFDIAQRYRERRERDLLKDWVDTSGAEYCHREIDILDKGR